MSSVAQSVRITTRTLSYNYPSNLLNAWTRLFYPQFGANRVAPVATPWSLYVRLMSVKDDAARNYYEGEAMKGEWSVDQTGNFRVSSTRGQRRSVSSQPGNHEVQTKSFAIHLCSTFLTRQKRLFVGTVWHHIDLLFFHRLLRCLVILDLKIGRFSHGDAG